jgi:hypothetical protein
MIRAIATSIHFVLTLPFPRWHHNTHHTTRIEERHGSLHFCCNQCERSRPVNLHLTLDEIQERKVRE